MLEGEEVLADLEGERGAFSESVLGSSRGVGEGVKAAGTGSGDSGVKCNAGSIRL